MRIPTSMATQHPDSASRYVPVQEEVEEAVDCIRAAPHGLGCDEYMVDYEGKMTPYHQTAQVVSRLISEGVVPGESVFVTPRIPSASEENVFRQLMTILSVVEANFNSGEPSVREVVHPMTRSARELVYTRRRISEAVELARDGGGGGVSGSDIGLIPLVEEVPQLLGVGDLAESYVARCREDLGLEVERLRVMLGRSDPALQFGMVPAVLGNKLAVASLHRIEGVEVGPIFGGGYLPFRGHVSPENAKNLAEEFAGIRTATVQSGIRYDRDREATQELTEALGRRLPGGRALDFSQDERELLVDAAGRFAEAYLPFLYSAAPALGGLSDLIPSQRDRLTRTGDMGYSRDVPEAKALGGACTDPSLSKSLAGLQRDRLPPLPRAIKFTAALYTVGLPPEFVGTGRGMEALTSRERGCLLERYSSLETDLAAAAPYLDLDTAEMFLPAEAVALAGDDVAALEEYFDLEFGHARDLYSILMETMRPILEEVLSGESEIIVDGEAERELLNSWILRLGEMRGSLG
ncbi:MAG: Phosphoenolpyruvate carboxylase [Methanonatronarchaeales archaeon]|nr:Phosphoenolpyruvate carboxylase [Methanonatronarchaeales archaeon]